MASILGNYTDSLVVVYDNNNSLLCQTIVLEHDRNENYIGISEGLEKVKTGTRLHLLIIHSDGASEYSGILKRVRQGIFEVLIFGEHQRDARGKMRHTLNAPAVVKDIVVNAERVTLIEPVPLVVVNISPTGVLISSPELDFIIGVILQIEFNFLGKNTIIYAKTVREQRNGDGIYRYGCQLIFLK